MNCYRCGGKLGSQDMCLKCGAPVRAYKKILYTSNGFYNEGLYRAQSRDLTGAIECLLRSLKYNKKNIDARNLLGLIYYEIGEEVEAMTEWVISKNFQPENNIANTYLNRIQEKKEYLEQINTVVRKFNQGLFLANDDSLDLAVLQIRKVVNLNPHFMKAYRLLALLYMQMGEYAKAYPILKTALSIDRTDIICLKYMSEVKEAQPKTGETKKRESAPLKPSHTGNDDVIVPTYKEKRNIIGSILHVLGGVVLGIVIAWFLILPSMRQNMTRDANEKIMGYGDMLSSKEVEVMELQSQIESLTKEKEKVEDALDTYTGKSGVINEYNALLNVLKSYITDDYIGAVEGFYKIDSTIVHYQQFQDMYQTLKEDFDVNGVRVLYESGRAAYESRDFETAKKYFQKCLELQPDYPEVMYWLGLCFHNTGDMTTAVQYYTQVIDNYPGTTWEQNARKVRGY